MRRCPKNPNRRLDDADETQLSSGENEDLTCECCGNPINPTSEDVYWGWKRCGWARCKQCLLGICHVCALTCHHCEQEYCNACLDTHIRVCPENPDRQSADADGEADDATTQSDETPCDRCGDPMA
eukprot:7085432-Karenia_brevis.AAC.1